jgi:hypothetical protein
VNEMPDPATRDRLLEGLCAGLAATLLMTGLVFCFALFGLATLPGELAWAVAALTRQPLWLALGIATHLAYGALAGALYFAGARRVTVGGGALFGLGLWGLALSVYAPLVGLGFVAHQRPDLALLALPPHLLYGIALGAFAPRGEITNPLLDVPQTTP